MKLSWIWKAPVRESLLTENGKYKLTFTGIAFGNFGFGLLRRKIK